MNQNYPVAYYNTLDTDIILWLREIDRKAKGPLMLSQILPHPC